MVVFYISARPQVQISHQPFNFPLKSHFVPPPPT
uniref:Uncharacterized protein n=1 Tax=Arundo donax TaxID=35708 RepID=A0A0A8YC93_ARUDO